MNPSIDQLRTMLRLMLTIRRLEETATESLIGVLLMAMFLVCLAHKFGRA